MGTIHNADTQMRQKIAELERLYTLSREKNRLYFEKVARLRAFVAAYDQWDSDDVEMFGPSMERMQAARRELGKLK